MKANGRFYIRDLKTGRLFLVEAIGHPRTEFGDSITDKCAGSIREKDSQISDRTHKNIGYANNPTDYINRLLAQERVSQ